MSELNVPAMVAPWAMVPMSEEGDGGYHAPTVEEFFPGQLLGEDTFWGPTRINLIGLLMTGALCLFFVLAFRRPKVLPGPMQSLGELAVDAVYVNIIDEVMGARGRRFAPLLVTMFWMILAFNITGILPLMHISATAVIGVPLMLALVTYVVFNWAGIREHGLGPYLRMNLFPSGVPAPIYVLVTPIELISTFVLRPVTLTIRLLANMMSGHMLLVLFFGATSYFLFELQGVAKVLAVPSYFMGFVFTLFEVVVALLQAYVFTLLTAVYIDGATSHEH